MKNNKYKIFKSELYYQYKKLNKSILDIAKLYKCCSTWIYKCLKYYHIKIKSRRISHLGKKRPEHSKLMTGKGNPMFGKKRPDSRQRMLGKNNPGFINGQGKFPYPMKFNNVLKKSIRKRDNYTCQLCHKNGKSIHHINYNKQDCRKRNLITLCMLCNCKANFNRDYYFAYFSYLIERGRKR